MNYASPRTFRVATGVSSALLLLAGGAWWSSMPYKDLLAFSFMAGGVLMLIITLWRTHRQSSQLTEALEQLARGQWKTPSDQVAEQSGLSSVNALYRKLHEAADFIETLEATETTGALTYVRADERLGKALLTMKSTLNEYRGQEEERHWSAQGLAHFADILRNQVDSLEAFSDQVIRHLVQYLEVNQGGIFVKTEAEGNEWYELLACYAYDRKRYTQKRYAPGQGLVGQCALEQKMILLTEVPDQYTTITSGLGEATPTTLVIVPLCWNEQIYGVIELAAFQQLAPYQLVFLEKVAENIASSLSVVQTGAHLQRLLHTSQQLTQEYEQLSLVANNTDNSVVIADQQGRIKFVNQGFTRLTGYTADEALGNKPGHLLQGPDTDPAAVQRIRQKLKGGTSFYEEILNYRKSGESYWISLTINPIKNAAGEIEQYISIQADVTQIKQQTLDYTYKLEAISRSNAVVEFSPQGVIVDANELFLNVTGYQKEDLIGKNHSHLLSETERQSPQTQMMWENLQAGTYFSGEFKQQSKQGEELWLSGTFNPIFDLQNSLQKILMFAQFTTYEKEKQHELAGVVQAFTGAVLTFDMTPEGKLKKANALFLERFGYQRREISRLKLPDLVAPDSYLPDIVTVLAQQDSVRVPLVLQTKSGEKVAGQGLFSGIKNLEDTLAKVVVIVLEDRPQ